jgi:hypothetical protein
VKPTGLGLVQRGLGSLLDISEFLFGDFIGRGTGREVYACRYDPSLVVKLVTVGNANTVEWENWRSLENAPTYSRWLAPCIAISARGDVMLQRRTTPVPPAQLPKRLPGWLTDIKPSNFGLLDGKIVAHDYNTLAYLTRRDVGMVKAVWRSDWDA